MRSFVGVGRKDMMSMSRIFDEPNDRAVIESNSLPFILPNLLEPQIAHCEEISSRYKDVLENKLNPVIIVL
jgi:hypothetical protein